MGEIVRSMSQALIHRGPDDEGAWTDQDAGIALGFRRLSIIDLSPTGHQPMLSHSGRYVIVFNGEIYNFNNLRNDLVRSGSRFIGTSDTEVILELVERHGIQDALKRLNGMFAIALWDRQERVLTLMRDRIGIKPLYYGWQNGTFLFASELKALKLHPDFSANVNREVLELYLRHAYIPAPHSIYQSIHKLMPGTFLQVNGKNRELSPSSYWSARAMVEKGQQHQFDGSLQEAGDQLESILKNSIRQRMISDVPLGAFLSGGVDSSTVVAIMQSISTRPVKTFTIGFWEKDYDEARFAKQIASHLHTDHTELYVTARDALDVIPALPRLYDEPFADSSQIPTYLISKLAREEVTVSLSGDGGDELFGGYNRYLWSEKILRINRFLPGWLKEALLPSHGNENEPRGLLMRILTSDKINAPQKLQKINKIKEILNARDLVETYLMLISQWNQPGEVLVQRGQLHDALAEMNQWPHLSGIPLMMYLDLITYLPDDILVKVDRASMGVSLEARVPFIDDHEIIEFAWRLPLNLKIRGSRSKLPLRDVLYRYVPKELIERPKMGFAMPIGKWLQTSLRGWAEDLLTSRSLQNEIYFKRAPILAKWREHQNGERDWQYQLWPILIFQAWLNANHLD